MVLKFMNKIALAIHGGAGTIRKSEMTAESETEYRRGLENALEKGWEVLRKNGTALDAVEAAVVELENFPLFNAGRGAVFNHAGKNELDAAIMNGATGKAGAVASVSNVVNPIKLARLVMERTEHILLGGDGANEFAREMDIEFAPDDYFYTAHRHQQFLQARETGSVRLDHAEEMKNEKWKMENGEQKRAADNRKPIGTVGAAACDSSGNLAAATSTGGMTNKRFGRIGDTPVIGAGTFADNRTCAVSCTGHGEFFMRTLAAYDVSARMKYKKSSLEKAAGEVIENLRRIGGEGGLIAVDALGNVAMPFNSDGMYRGLMTADGVMTVEIYR